MLRHLALRRVRWFVLFALVGLLFVRPPSTLFAASTRFISPLGTDSGNCLTAATPCKTFTYAITQAIAGDTISAAVGTYTENLTLTKNLTLKGAGLNSTILDGNFANRVLDVGAGLVIQVSGMTLQNGKATNAAGGGIRNNGTLTLTNVSVSKNQASGGTVDRVSDSKWRRFGSCDCLRSSQSLFTTASPWREPPVTS